MVELLSTRPGRSADWLRVESRTGSGNGARLYIRHTPYGMGGAGGVEEWTRGGKPKTLLYTYECSAAFYSHKIPRVLLM